MSAMIPNVGCMTRSRRPCSEAIAEKGGDFSMDTVREALGAARKHGKKPQTR